MDLKHLLLFENFIKKYDQKITVQEFENIKKGSTVLYMGGRFTVEDNLKSVLKLKNEDGETFTVNYNMFNSKGAIPNT